jgi:predicted RecB family nuclease
MTGAAARTAQAIKDASVPTIFEGAFLEGGYAARADILRRSGSRWHLVEVKSSLNDKEEFIDDMAYTAMVLQKCGLGISRISLILISKDFRLGMSNRDLFVEIDHTDDVLLRTADFRPLWDKVEEITSAAATPDAKLSFECRKCSLFPQCLGKDTDNHIFDIPRLSQSKFDQLMDSCIVRIEDIPRTFPLTDNQAVVREAVQTGKPVVGRSLSADLARIEWPAYYLDFETFMTAIPFYPEIAPYTQIPTQCSVHECSAVGTVARHFEYLADPAKDCRPELAERLVETLQGTSSIVVYSNFEKTVISNLAKNYLRLARKLEKLIDRMVDLEAIIRKNFCHPDFHGSTSIKQTLPALVPDMNYDDLPIADGDSAMAAFAYLALGRYGDREAENIKRSLLSYCKQDTLAMVRLHHRLAEYV